MSPDEPLKVDDHPEDRQAGSLMFRRGWVASTATFDHDVAGAWAATTCGPLHLRVHPALGWTRIEKDDRVLMLLGEPADVISMSFARSTIARTAFELATNADEEALLRFLAALGGRFLCLVSTPSGLEVIPDAGATISTYWMSAGSSVFLSSHSHLVAEIGAADRDEQILTLMAAAGRESPYVVYPPGLRTPFAGVRPLLANHTLTVAAGRVDHERFYPFDDTELAGTTEHAFERFEASFTRHVQLLGSGRCTSISLTAGRDSQATLAAFAPFTTPDDFAWTVYDFGKATLDTRRDLVEANRSADAIGLRHRVIDGSASSHPAFTEAMNRTFAAGSQARNFAGAVFDQVPHATTNLQSMIAEVGTGFYKARTDDSTSAARLASIYTSRPHGRHPESIAAFEEFIEYAQFTPDRFGPYDHHDLLYWESRVSLWVSLRIQELEISHTVALPYNVRSVIEALATPDFEYRINKRALARFAAARRPPRAVPGGG